MTKQNTIIYTDSLKDNFDKIYVLYYSRMHRFAKEYGERALQLYESGEN